MNKAAYIANYVDQNLKKIRNDMLYHRGQLEQLKEQQELDRQNREKVTQPQNLNLAQNKPNGETVRWVVSNKSGHLDLKPERVKPGDSVEILSQLDREENSLELPPYLRIIGHKINLRAQVESLKESFVKNYIQTKSHNLILAKFAEFKISILGWLLSVLGVSSLELQRLQKKAIEGALRENKLLFEENEYNAELISIIGGNTRQAKGQLRVVAELRKQIIAQCERMGLKEYFTDEFITEIRLKQCRSIMTRFKEEEIKLEYQLAYC